MDLRNVIEMTPEQRKNYDALFSYDKLKDNLVDNSMQKSDGFNTVLARVSSKSVNNFPTTDSSDSSKITGETATYAPNSRVITDGIMGKFLDFFAEKDSGGNAVWIDGKRQYNKMKCYLFGGGLLVLVWFLFFRKKRKFKKR